jgi:hypothetical protein
VEVRRKEPLTWGKRILEGVFGILYCPECNEPLVGIATLWHNATYCEMDGEVHGGNDCTYYYQCSYNHKHVFQVRQRKIKVVGAGMLGKLRREGYLH